LPRDLLSAQQDLFNRNILVNSKDQDQFLCPLTARLQRRPTLPAHQFTDMMVNQLMERPLKVSSDVVQMLHHSNTTTSVLLTPRDPQEFGLILNKVLLDPQDFQDPIIHPDLRKLQVLPCSALLALQR
jgi:hypothetical protein